MINVHYSKRIRNPFTTSFSNADTPSSFWREFQYYFYTLTREYICLTLQGVITGILYTNCPMLNSLLSYTYEAKLSYTYEVAEEIRLFQIQLLFHPRLKLSMKQKSSYVLKQIKWTNLIKKWALPFDSIP